MFAAIRNIFLKGGTIKDAIAYVFKATGNMPTKSEGMKIIKMYQDIQKDTAKIFQFPKDRITNPFKSRPEEEAMVFTPYIVLLCKNTFFFNLYSFNNLRIV